MINLPPGAERIQKAALLVGALGLLVSFGSITGVQFSRSYLLGYLFWISIPLGYWAIFSGSVFRWDRRRC